MRQIKVSFLAQGHINQTINVLDARWTDSDIINGLNDGTLSTTVQKNGTVDITETDTPIAVIVNVDNQLEYAGFKLLA